MEEEFEIDSEIGDDSQWLKWCLKRVDEKRSWYKKEESWKVNQKFMKLKWSAGGVGKAFDMLGSASIYWKSK